MPEPTMVSAILAELRANLGALRRDGGVDVEANRRMAQRYDRLAPWRGFVTDEDFARIADDKLDSRASIAVRRFVAARDTNPRARFLWLAGPRGTGKTVAALWAVCEDYGRYVTAEELRRAYGQEHDEARGLRPRLVEARLLIIDDIGTSKDGAGEERALFELLNARQGGGRQTILTGNLSRAEVSTKFCGRVLDRVFHSGAVVDCGTTNLRRAPGRAES